MGLEKAIIVILKNINNVWHNFFVYVYDKFRKNHEHLQQFFSWKKNI